MDVELDIDRALGSFAETAEKIISGNTRGLRVTKWHFVPAPKYQPQQICAIRKHLRLTQEAFAAALNVDRNTVASWETGRKKPAGPALRLLEFVEREPNLVSPDLERTAAQASEQLKAVKTTAHRRALVKA